VLNPLLQQDNNLRLASLRITKPNYRLNCRRGRLHSSTPVVNFYARPKQAQEQGAVGPPENLVSALEVTPVGAIYSGYDLILKSYGTGHRF